MKTRVITAIIFASVMLAGLLTHVYSFVLLISLLGIGCLWEFFGLVFAVPEDAEEQQRVHRQRRLFYTLMSGIPLVITGLVLIFGRAPDISSSPANNFWELIAKPLNDVSVGIDNYKFLLKTLIKALLILLALPLILMIYELFTPSSRQPFVYVGMGVLAAFYIMLPFAATIFIANPINWLGQFGEFRPLAVLSILLLVWANDSFAYLIGSQLGKNKLFERISPKKTWEGSIGGFFMTMATGLLLSVLMPKLGFKAWDIDDYMIIGSICALFGTLGDLVESMLKRSLSIKDSGSILPGHGGFLDRFDAYIFVVPFVLAYIVLKELQFGRF